MFCTTLEAEGEVVHVKNSLSPPVITGRSNAVDFVVVLCCLFLVLEFRRCFTLRVFILVLVREWPPFAK